MSLVNPLIQFIKCITLMILIAAIFRPITVDAASSKHIRVRISHAKELLGKNYKKSVVHKTERADDVAVFIKATTKRFLPKAYKKDSDKLATTISKEAERYGFDPIFLMAVIQNESSFNPTRKGSVGEIGLMQIKPDTAEWIAKVYKIRYSGSKDLFDPEMNVKIGAAFMHKLRTQFESESRLYLSAYNIGAKKVRRLVSGKKTPKEYVLAVMKRYIAIYSAFNTEGDHHQKSQMAWVKVSHVTNKNPNIQQVVTN